MDTRNIRDIEAFDLRERILKDICRTAETVEQRNLGRIRRKYPNEAQAEAAYYDCRMSAAVNMVDKWGVRFIPEICKAFEVDETEVNDFISDAEVAAVVDLEGRETAEAAAEAAADLEGQKDTADTIEELAKKDAAEHGPHLTEREHNALTRALREYQIETAHLLDRLNASVTLCMGRTVPNYELDEKPFTDVEMNVLHEALDFAGSEAAQRGQADEVLEYETIGTVLRKYEGQQDDKTGAADPGTVSEIMKRLKYLKKHLDKTEAFSEITMEFVQGMGNYGKGTDPNSIASRLNRIEESLHNIGQQVEAIWLKTGAVELDAESIAEDLEETEPEQ